MSKQKNITAPLYGMNRNTGGQSLTEQQYAIQVNGRADTDEMYALTDEHSNILASKFKEGYKFIGGKNHVVRNKTYIFLTNPETGCSEIGYILNTTDFTYETDVQKQKGCVDCIDYVNVESTPLEHQEQQPHQLYETLLSDCCEQRDENGDIMPSDDNYKCLGFDIDHPIIDIIIKEQNIGTKMFWTDSPGNKEFRYIELDNIGDYSFTGDDNCGAVPTSTCVDCDKLRVFRLHTELKTKEYDRVLGGNLKKGSYEVLGAYSDILGNEFTSYVPLTSIIPIFDEANVIHEQADNNAETNFAIKIELDNVDVRFDYYKIAVRYFTSKGVFTSFVEGIHGTSDKTVVIANNNGVSISNTKLALVKPFIETVDGITASNNILILNGIREREPVNLQPVINLAGLGVQWMSFRAKESLYANADSYKYIGYNRDENVGLAIDFGFTDGYRTTPQIFVPRPSTEDDREDFSSYGKDYSSIVDVAGDCDGNIRDKKWQFYNTATEVDICPFSGNENTVTQFENVVTYTTVEPIFTTFGELEIDEEYIINTLESGDDFTNVGFVSEGVAFTATATTPTVWTNNTVVIDVNESIPLAPANTLVIELDNEIFINLADYIVTNIDSCNSVNSPIASICSYIDVANLTSYNNPPTSQANCDDFVLTEEEVGVDSVTNEHSTLDPKPIGDYPYLAPSQFCDIYVFDSELDGPAFDLDFAYGYNVLGSELNTGTGNYVVGAGALSVKKRKANVYNTTCLNSKELTKITLDNMTTSNYGSFYHLNKGAENTELLSGDLINGDSYIINTLESGDDFTNVGFVSEGVAFTATATTPTVWTNNTVVIEANNSIDSLLTDKVATVSGGGFNTNIHEGSLWFNTKINNRNKFLIELTQVVGCEEVSYVSVGSTVRVSIFDKCSSINAIHSEILDVSDHRFIEIDVENGSMGGTPYDFSLLLTDVLYISVEVPIVTSTGYGENWGDVYVDGPITDGNFTTPPFSVSRLAPLCGCFNIVDREEEFSSVTVSYDNIVVTKSQKYETNCEFQIPILKDCKPVPYKYGELGYYESTDEYPDNEELYDSSKLIIKKDTVTNDVFLEKLKLHYMESETSTEVLLSEDADFRCEKIRYYKMPDNKMSPFIRTESVASNSESIISPLGFTIDGEIINNALDIAVDNGLITQEKRNSIVDYKIYRSDSTLNRSVVASGIVYNTKSYRVEGDEVHYFNYPFNSLGRDKYFPENTDGVFDKMQAISPEFDYYKPSLPNEMSLQGFMFGKSNTRVVPVKDHSKMTILGDKARSLANTLAILEVTAEITIAAAQAASNAQVWVMAGVSSGTSIGIPAYIASGVIIAVGAIEGLVGKVGRYRMQWEQAFENMGAPSNFGYYTTSSSNYNYLKTHQSDGNRLRGLSVGKYLKSGMLNVSDTTSGKLVRINNIDREEAAFFTLGNYPLDDLNLEYLSFDNSDSSPNFSSQVLSSEIGCHNGKSHEQLRNIASPYVAFKNYIPNQYGDLDSIKWVDTTYCIPIENTGVCEGILGGDTFISRHSKKRKARLFETDLLGSADNTPFPYRFNANYGNPRYYIDYKINSTFQSGNKRFPNIFYDVKFDCSNGTGSFYVEPPGKFYLYTTAFSNFLCETRVNTNFRNARKEPWNQFYPQNTDYEAITQPTTVSLTRPEQYFYNKAYLQTDVLTNVFSLPGYYSSENESKKAYDTNSGRYSLPDVNENSITEPWLLYRPNDKFTLESRFGKLTGMKGIESDQILMYYEDALQLQNAVNKFTDGSTQYNKDLGNGGIFAKRALTIKATDLGYGGSQSKHTLSCEFGHFHADLKRGQVFNYVGGTDMKEISRYSGGKPNGMDVWFKEHLPLKISKQFPEYTAADNPYNGAGIHWGYDSKHRRVLLTKKDYKPKVTVVNCGDKFYSTNIADYQTIIDQYSSNGYNLEGIEDCQLKFSNKGINSNTDVYAIFDTTSMQIADGQAASMALNTWFADFQANNPTFTGNMYIIPFGNEGYVNFPNLIQNGTIFSTTGQWSSISILPPNLNTIDWVPPTDLLLLAFVDESNPEYHGNTIIDGFSSSGVEQPTETFFNHYQDMKIAVEGYNSFKGIVYPIVQDVVNTGGALVLQAMAAIKGTILTPSDISTTNTTVDVSILSSENPYENAPIPGTVPQQLLQPLSTFDWVGQYDKTSPASAVFTSQQFQDDINTLISVEEEEEIHFEPLIEVSLTDSEYFEDISWTLTYKPETGSWESYMSYTPNYYINHTDYFQSGINSDDDRHGLWSHLLNNKSYRVFYGQKFPYIIEYPIKNEYLSKRLESISWNAQLRRYHNDYDYAPIEENPFTSVTIFNNYENSGELLPIKNNGALNQLSKYPVTKADNTQEVLVSYDDYRYNLSYFYNRVKNNRNNQPIWLWDDNQIEKSINKNAVSFYGKKTLERLKGNFFMVRLERDGNTNYDLDFRWSEQLTNPIR